MEDAVGLARVEVPDQLAIDVRRRGAHHAVHPVRVEERLVDHGRLVVELPVHGQVVAALHGDGAASPNLLGPDGHRYAHLTGHGGAADDRFVEFQHPDDFPDASNVALFVVRVIARDIVGIGE